TAPGSARNASMRSCSVWWGLFAGTTMTSYSAVSLAMGVVFASVTGASLLRMAPTITRPIIIRMSSWPDSVVASCARPIVPPAPGTLKTSTFETMPASCRAVCIAREVPSQPPPGDAGAMMRSDAGGCAMATPRAPRAAMSGRALATAVTWLLLALSAGAHGQDRLDAVDAYLEAAFAESSLPGMAVAVVSGGDVAYARGFGVADRESRAAVTVDTAFELGSLTKSMTALAVLRLAEAGRVDLDAPVRRYLPWFRVADADSAAAITPRHLLGHTSGLPRWSHGVVWRDPERVSGSVAEGVRALASVPLAFAPGEAVSYANMGYAVLGAVIEA